LFTPFYWPSSSSAYRFVNRLAATFEFEASDQDYARMADVIIQKHAHCEVSKIIHYMTGVHPDQVSEADVTKPGPAKCFALLYRGEDAIEAIRSKLGVTGRTQSSHCWPVVLLTPARVCVCVCVLVCAFQTRRRHGQAPSGATMDMT